MSANATWKVSAAVMASRVLGLIREVVFSAIFGTGILADCFTVAFRIPNLLRDLFAEGALSQAFVTTFSKRVEATGPESAWRLASRMLTLMTVLMSAITLLGIAFTPELVRLLAGTKAEQFTPEYVELTVRMTRIMWPFIPRW
jgi:putative peptidoglycan lipid II flippase